MVDSELPAVELFIVGRLCAKLFCASPLKFGTGEYVWKNFCIGAKISACGILRQIVPVWACWFCAFTGSGLPAASQRNGSRTKLAPTCLVEYGL